MLALPTPLLSTPRTNPAMSVGRPGCFRPPCAVRLAPIVANDVSVGARRTLNLRHCLQARAPPHSSAVDLEPVVFAVERRSTVPHHHHVERTCMSRGSRNAKLQPSSPLLHLNCTHANEALCDHRPGFVRHIPPASGPASGEVASVVATFENEDCSHTEAMDTIIKAMAKLSFLPVTYSCPLLKSPPRAWSSIEMSKLFFARLYVSYPVSRNLFAAMETLSYRHERTGRVDVYCIFTHARSTDEGMSRRSGWSSSGRSRPCARCGRCSSTLCEDLLMLEMADF